MASDYPPQAHNGPDVNASFVTSSLVGVAISLPILASVATALRFYARSLKGDGRSRADDWFLITTLVFCWAHSINTLVTGGIGGINTIITSPREYANIALRALWISSFFLVTSLYTVKISILLFYYHLFSIKQRFRKAVCVMIVILTLWWLSSIILIFCSTDPLSSSWKDAAHAKHRFDYNAWYTSYSGVSILFDITILCFPIPLIKSLRVNLRQKISIMCIFWLGGFVCISAIIRFVYLYNSMRRLTNLGENEYSSITVAFIWAEVEPNTAVIAACLPAYGPLFKEGTFFPKVAQSVKTVLHLSNKHTPSAHPSGLSNTDTSGYYELDKTITSKNNGDLFRLPDAKHSALHKEDVLDVEAAHDLDGRKTALPKAWTP